MSGFPDDDAIWVGPPADVASTGSMFLRCACGLTTIEHKPGEAVLGSCPTCGPLYAIPADVCEQVESIVGWMARP